nr:carbon storage regulator [Pirellulales bacterium]
VRLGIQAPAHVPVLRGEIAIAIAGDEQHKSSGEDEHDEELWPGEAESGRGPLRQLVAARGI